jgi:predicted  nucleic acid-binding Zn-ribbon protein
MPRTSRITQGEIEMWKKVTLAIGAAGMLTLPLFAQSAAPDTLSALLAEVRQLRIAMERTATIAPQVQLLAARLTVQNERLSRATNDHASVQEEIERITNGITQVSARIQELDAAGSTQTNPTEQRQLAAELRDLKRELEAQTAQETRLRARETELANVVAAEQNRWSDLNSRLDELERSLAQPR